MLAQAAATVAPEPQGVVSYPSAYFAAQNPNNALDMVSRLPGFSLNSGSGVRGFEGAAGNALVNGHRPTSKIEGLDQILQRIPAAKVERIDVIRGGAPGIDMQGKTVIANIITRSGGGARGLVATSSYTLRDGRQFNGARAEASGDWNGRAWELAFRAGSGPDDGSSTGRSVITFGDGSPRQVASLSTYGLSINRTAAGAFETPLAGGRLRLNGRLAHDRFKEPETDTITAPSPEIQVFGFAQQTDDTEIGGRFTRTLGGAVNLEIVGLRTTRDRNVDSTSLVQGTTSDFRNHAISSESIARGVLSQRLWEKVSVEAGVEFADNRLDSATRYVVGGANQDLPAANVRIQEKRAEAFLKATWRPTAAWTTDASLQYESSDISSAGDVVLGKTLTYVKPRLALTWQALPSSQVRLRFERDVGQLDFNDFVASSSLTNSVGVTAGNPNLNPQESRVAEAAVEQQVWAGASVLLTGRRSKLINVVDRGPVFLSDGTVFDRPTNIGSGTEDALVLGVTLPFDSLGWKGALLKGEVSRKWSAVTDPTTGVQRPISGVHPVDWNLNFSQDLPRQRLNLGVDVYGGVRRDSYRYNLVETFKLQTYVKPFVEWKATPAWSLRVEAPLITAPRVRLRDTLQIYPGVRSAGGAPDIQDRQFHFPPGIYFRILRNIG